MSIAPPTLPQCTQKLFKIQLVDEAEVDDVYKAGDLADVTKALHKQGGKYFFKLRFYSLLLRSILGDGAPTRAEVVDA